MMNDKFTKIKNKLIVSDMKDSEFRILCYLLSCSKNGKCFPSIRTMATTLNKSKETVRKTINNFEQQKILTKETRTIGTGKKTSNCYVIDDSYLAIKKTVEEPEREVQNIELYDYNWLEDCDD